MALRGVYNLPFNLDDPVDAKIMLKPAKTKTVHVKCKDNIQLHDMVRKASLAFYRQERTRLKFNTNKSFNQVLLWHGVTNRININMNIQEGQVTYKWTLCCS